jgi:DNA-binding NarL/FixJ family response regulator
MSTATKDQHIAELQEEIIGLRAKLELMSKLYERAQRATAPQSADPEAPLSRLTLKQHAVLLAELGGVDHEDIAKMMKADVSTIRLHLRAAMRHLDAENRNHLALKWRPVIDAIDDARYLSSYGIGKRWWDKRDR